MPDNTQPPADRPLDVRRLAELISCWTRLSAGGRAQLLGTAQQLLAARARMPFSGYTVCFFCGTQKVCYRVRTENGPVMRCRDCRAALRR